MPIRGVPTFASLLLLLLLLLILSYSMNSSLVKNVPPSIVHCAHLPAVVLVCESELGVCPSGPPTSLVFLVHIQVVPLTHG